MLRKAFKTVFNIGLIHFWWEVGPTCARDAEQPINLEVVGLKSLNIFRTGFKTRPGEHVKPIYEMPLERDLRVF